MVSITSMPSTTSVMSAYAAFVASAMFFQTIVREIQNLIKQIIPHKLQEKFVSFLEGFFGSISSQMTLVIEETNGLTTNEIYHASEIYLGTRITPSIGQLKVYKDPRESGISLTIDKGQKVLDGFDGINLVWQSVHKDSRTINNQTSGYMVTADGRPKSRKNSVERLIKLSFEKQHMGIVVNAYLPYVLERAKAIKAEKKVVKLHTLGHNGEVNLNHPSTFETLAMDPDVKQDLKDDLDRFLKRKDLYRKVGKPWKRGYLLYGPPGTGKSSLIAAMANYLKFDIYDLELSGLRSNNGLKSLMSNTKNRSILVTEDIDCSAEMPTRQSVGQSQLTLSGLLNFIDGLWSSCGDERIIVFTTNYKERLDPALLRPGRMDMHIHMSYCTPSGFRTLASNYHSIKSHRLFDKIDQLITKIEVTPAEIAEELLKSEDADTALQGLIRFLLKKKEMKYEQPDTSKQSKETDNSATENEREIQGKGDKLQKSSFLSSRDGSLFGVSYVDNY